MFGEGPMLEDHWYNPKTGDSFTVRDTFFEDNNLIVMTTDGRRMNYDMISRYVKTDKPMPKQQPEPRKQEIPQSILNQVLPVTNDDKLNQPIKKTNYDDLLTDEDRALLGAEVDTAAAEVRQTIQKPESVIEDEDTMLIRRILKKATSPTVDCKITWNNFPAKQFDMLDMMAVEPEKIADYYLASIDIASLREIVKKSIHNYIDKMLNVKKSIHDDYIDKMLSQQESEDDSEEKPAHHGDTISSGEKAPVTKPKLAPKPVKKTIKNK